MIGGQAAGKYSPAVKQRGCSFRVMPKAFHI